MKLSRNSGGGVRVGGGGGVRVGAGGGERGISVSKMEKFGLVFYTAPYSIYCKRVSVYLFYFFQ